MKTFVKIFGLLLAFSTVSIGQRTLSIEKVIGTIGDTESVTVSIDSTVNIKSISMLIKYDPSSLTYPLSNSISISIYPLVIRTISLCILKKME